MRRPLAAVLVLSALTTTSACSLFDTSSPRRTVDALTAALARGDLAGVPITAAGAAEAGRYPELLAGLEGWRPAVSAEAVEQVDAGRTKTSAVLNYRWTWRDQHWDYSTDVQLVKQGRQWLVDWQPSTLEPDLAAGQRFATRRVAAERADINGGTGRPLVTMREVRRIGIDKSQLTVPEQAESARRLARVLDIDAGAFARAVRSAGPQAFVEGLVVRASQTDELARISAAAGRIPGARLVTGTLPLAPTRTFARETLGVAGPATKEIVDASHGEVVPGQFAGLSGLQKRYDEQLRGVAGLEVRAVNADGSRPRSLHTFPATPGQPLNLTLEEKPQKAAEAALAGVKPAAALVAIRPSTGRIVAIANGPGAQGRSVATAGAYPPGSTFKIVTALALLRHGLTPESEVSCPATTTVDGRRFENYDDYPSGKRGRVSLQTAFANSCNTAFISRYDSLQPGDLADAASSLGLNTDPDLGYPFRLGGVPAAAADASATERAASLIGQGKVTSNALGLATVVASVLKGERVTPELLVNGPADPTAPARPLTAAEADQLRRLMRAVASEGSARRLGLGDGVLAKTGTAEYGTDSPPRTHAWLVAGRGDLAVAVFVADGASGSGTAGPILTDFLAAVG